MLVIRKGDTSVENIKKIKIYSEHPDKASWTKKSKHLDFTGGVDSNFAFFTWKPERVEDYTGNGLKIAFIIEPYSLVTREIDYVYDNYKKFDYIITHDDRLLTLPNSFRYFWGGVWDSDITIPKTKNLSIICSNKNYCALHNARLEIARYIKKNRLGDTFGTFDGGEMVDTITSHSPYKFAIVVENHIGDWWFTEKICNCFANKTVPIYIGARRIGEVFNSDGIIKVDNIAQIKTLLRYFDYDTEYSKRLDAIEDNYKRVFKYKNVWDNIYNDFFVNEIGVKSI